MAENTAMFESFKLMLDMDKAFVISKIGRPSMSFPSFAIYHRNKLWMVLYFKDERIDNCLHSLLKGVTFYDDTLKLLWSSGIRLLPNSSAVTTNELSTISEVIGCYGEPHAMFGTTKSALQYLSEDGNIVFVQYSGENVIEITPVSLPKLTNLG